MRDARRGNEAAFLRLSDEHYLQLFRFAWRLMGSIADAEDIVQECLLALLRPNCGFDPTRTTIRTYLLGAVRNQSLKREHPVILWIWGITAAIVFIDGIHIGFISAGIGGAIASGFGYLILGIIAGGLAALLVILGIKAIPLFLLLFVCYAIFWIVRALWNVGKP